MHTAQFYNVFTICISSQQKLETTTIHAEHIQIVPSLMISSLN